VQGAGVRQQPDLVGRGRTGPHGPQKAPTQLGQAQAQAGGQARGIGVIHHRSHMAAATATGRAVNPGHHGGQQVRQSLRQTGFACLQARGQPRIKLSKAGDGLRVNRLGIGDQVGLGHGRPQTVLPASIRRTWMA
jgi:hypothetical protein